MGNATVLIVDYGLGNLFSVERALRYAGASCEISSEPSRIMASEKVVLPGVGAFGDGVKELKKRGLIGPLKEYASSGRPLVGICLGMQLLMSEGEEFGMHEGLGIVKGRTLPIIKTASYSGRNKIPHVGWNRITPYAGRREGWSGSMLEGIGDAPFVYFVHSNTVVPDDDKDCFAQTEYDGVFCSAVRKGNIYGFQFHPERSGETGLEILRAFAAL